MTTETVALLPGCFDGDLDRLSKSFSAPFERVPEEHRDEGLRSCAAGDVAESLDEAHRLGFKEAGSTLSAKRESKEASS